MSENMNCPCCGAIPGQAHDDDCMLVAFINSTRATAHIIDSQGLAVPVPKLAPGKIVPGERMSTTLPDRCTVCGDTEGGWCSIRGCPRPMPASLLAPKLVPGQIVSEPAPHEEFHHVMHAPGYEALADVLQRAFAQAAHGKGKERHAQGEPFTEQVMQDMARRFGVGALLGQAFKKSEESQRLPLDRGVAELLGAIVYLAGAVIAREREAQSNPTTN
jgi:hypothetical protein